MRWEHMRDRAIRVPLLLAAVTVLGQILWVLVPTNLRTVVTVTTVTSFFLASATHALVRRGLRWAAIFVAVTLVFGWAVEAVGTATGLPFGDYTYTDALGWQLRQVPWVIPLAWSMMAYPCLLAAQRLTSGRIATPLVGGALFASWDLFLDPQMVGEGYWNWHDPGFQIPGIPGIPAQNFVGWLLVSVLLMVALDRLPRVAAGDEVPHLLLTWTYLSNVMAAAVFFGRPAVAVWGGLLMGAWIIPWWRRLARA